MSDLKIYVRDWGWEGAAMVVTADPAVAYAKLIQPMIDQYLKLAQEHDAHWPPERHNPNWAHYYEHVEKGLGLCDIYDVVEGLEFGTAGEY